MTGCWFPSKMVLMETNYITFTTADFYTMMGRLALPPWSDGKKVIVGENFDCGALADEIIKEAKRLQVHCVPVNWEFLWEESNHG